MKLPTQVLNEIRAHQFTLLQDVGWYTLHVVPDRPEVALRPTASDPGVYLRAYVMVGDQRNPEDTVRLILDDVVFEDEVDFSKQIMFSAEDNDWVVRDVTAEG